jgi:2-methylcitrate dehydratase
MDKTLDKIVAYTTDFTDHSPSDDAMDAALRHLVDAIACAVAGAATAPAQIAVQVAGTVRGDDMATVFGAGIRSTPAYAAFANTVMVRTLDWNDGMLARSGGHPSDMIPAILAAAEVCGTRGEEVLASIVLAYEILGSLGAASADGPTVGVDQGIYMGAATALAVGRLRGLTAEQLANAASLSIVPAIPLMVTRRGALSMWKGAATAQAIMNATNAVAYAGRGMTGPAEPFEGIKGVMEVLTGPYELALPLSPSEFVVEMSHQKRFPAESHSQALLAVMPEVREWTSPDHIESVEVEAYRTLYNAIGSHPSVWDPKTRETADHSLPYLLAVALTDGDITPASFSDERIADPSLRPLMAKIKVSENPEFSAQYRPAGLEIAGSPRATITVRRDDGEVMFREVTYPVGHALNPMRRADIDEKLAKATRGVLDDATRDELAQAWWRIGEAPDIHEAMSKVADFGASHHR